jgi:L-alanine-DL-glutamate epimerase-like enolase superfamily enzyme
MNHPTRRSLLASAAGAAALAAATEHKPAPTVRPEELDHIAAKPVLKRELFKDPLIIDSIRLLKSGNEHFVHVRTKSGAEGMSVTQPGRADYLNDALKQLVIPFLIGKDARDLEDLLWELYRHNSNYKMYGLMFWSPQAWAEFAILDLLGRVAGKPIGALLGDIVRQEVPIYVASGRRDTTPEAELEYLQKLVSESGAKALKFRVGGRMSRNADASPRRTERLIPMVRKAFPLPFDLHADSNSSYDPPLAIKVGRMLEDAKFVYFEEPCPFDHIEDMKIVTDTLTIPVAWGEQEYSDWRFRNAIATRAADIMQPDIQYYGGLIRSLRVARMAHAAGMPTTVHISGGFGFIYMLHLSSVVPDVGKYQEYKLGVEKYNAWLTNPIVVKDGKMSIPQSPGVGIKDVSALVREAKEV